MLSFIPFLHLEPNLNSVPLTHGIAADIIAGYTPYAHSLDQTSSIADQAANMVISAGRLSRVFRTVRLLSYEASEWGPYPMHTGQKMGRYSQSHQRHYGLGMNYETVFLTPSIAGYFFYMVRRISQPADMQKIPAIWKDIVTQSADTSCIY